jgi:hypothetical protein
VRLTIAGAELQRAVGLSHGRRVAQAMTRHLDRRQLLELSELCLRLTTDSEPANPGEGTPQGSALEVAR